MRTINVALCVLAALICAPLVAGAIRMVTIRMQMNDFVAYWAAARLFLAQRNPYSTEIVRLEVQALHVSASKALLFHNPPWVLAFFAPLGLLTLRAARLLWLFLSLALDVFSAVGLWKYFGGGRRTSWIALLVFLTFIPLATAEHIGQITPLILAGTTALLLLLERKQWVLAGMAAVVLGIKPQLMWLVIPAFVLWAIGQRKFRFLSWAVLTWCVLWSSTLLYDPAAVHFLRDAYGWSIDQSYGPGGALRLLFGIRHHWLQYAPSAPGAIWFGWYWLRNRRDWDWSKQLPLLLIISVATSVYCGFADFVVCLPAFVALAVRGGYRSGLVLVAWLLVQVAIFEVSAEAAMALVSSVGWTCFWWLANSEAHTLSVPDHIGKTTTA